MPRKNSNPALAIAALVLALAPAAWLPPAARAADRTEWAVVAEVESVEIRIHWVSREELVAAARRVGKRPGSQPLGFSVLQREVESGRYICDIYLPERPRRVDDHATLTLGHEASHCLGLSHE